MPPDRELPEPEPPPDALPPDEVLPVEVLPDELLPDELLPDEEPALDDPESLPDEEPLPFAAVDAADFASPDDFVPASEPFGFWVAAAGSFAAARLSVR